MTDRRITIKATCWTPTGKRTVERTIAAQRRVVDYRKVRSLYWLNRDIPFQRQSMALDALDTAARTVRLMDATGMVPSQSWVSLFGRDDPHGYGFDHTLTWAGRDGGQFVTTEPYAADDPSRVLDWCFDHEWDARILPAWGMWNPPRTTLILCAPRRWQRAFDDALERLQAGTTVPIEREGGA